MIAVLRGCAHYFILAGFFSLFINTLQLTFSLYMLAVYHGVIASHSLSTLLAITLLALAALTVWGCLEYCRSRLLVLAGIKIDRLLSRTVLKEMLRDLARIDSVGYVNGLKDINTLRNYLGGSSIFAFFDVPWILVYLGIIYLIHPILGLTATVGAVAVLAIGLMQSRLSQKDQDTASAFNKQGKQWFLASLRMAKELQGMGMIRAAGMRLCSINDQELHFHDKASIISHLLGAVSQSFGVWMQVVIFGVGATLVLLGEANPGVIIAASIITGQALSPIKVGIGAWKQTADARTAFSNLSSLLAVSEERETVNIGQIKGRLEVAGVSLVFEGKHILHHIDFCLRPGEIMGLIGSNGAGKTSLCRLMLGNWAPTSGSVRLDGLEVSTIDKEQLGNFIGYLPQNVELFAGTIKENIARMSHADADRVVEAAKWAGVHETILRLPGGYNTDIGEAGENISGGQRQRVGLARALFGKPSLVILDEPNANLDEAGEHALLQALKWLKKQGTTTILITHKPSLLAAADKILLVQNGKQIQFGDRSAFLG